MAGSGGNMARLACTDLSIYYQLKQPNGLYYVLTTGGFNPPTLVRGTKKNKIGWAFKIEYYENSKFFLRNPV